MAQKIFLDMLNQDSVSIVTKQMVEVNGIEYFIGGEHRCAYENSKMGREMLQREIEEPYLSAVLVIWGDSPTVVVPSKENHKEESEGDESE